MATTGILRCIWIALTTLWMCIDAFPTGTSKSILSLALPTLETNVDVIPSGFVDMYHKLQETTKDSDQSVYQIPMDPPNWLIDVIEETLTAETPARTNRQKRQINIYDPKVQYVLRVYYRYVAANGIGTNQIRLGRSTRKDRSGHHSKRIFNPVFSRLQERQSRRQKRSRRAARYSEAAWRIIRMYYARKTRLGYLQSRYG